MKLYSDDDYAVQENKDGGILKELNPYNRENEGHEPAIINLDQITDDEHLTWCEGIKKALAITSPYSSPALDSLVLDYAASRGGELIVKDASALYSLMVAPKKESGCDGDDLEELFVGAMIERHPKATNLMVGTVRSKYVRIAANENGSLSVSNFAGFDQDFSINL